MSNAGLRFPALCFLLAAAASATLLKCQTDGHAYAVGQFYSTGCDFCRCQLSGPLCQRGVLCLGKRRLLAKTCEHSGVSHALGTVYSTGLALCRCTEAGPKCIYLPGKKRQVLIDLIN